MAAPDTAPEIAGFTHVRVLGSGGFADVHLYRQRFPRRQVAIKVLKVDTLDRETRRQFVAEANVMAQLSTHPAIATIHSADITADGRPYLVMEYCSGGSLGVRYRDRPLDVEEALEVGVRIASALESAHGAGVIHRDVKPANILITDYGDPVLTDFGISIGDDVLSEATVFRTAHSAIDATTTGASGTAGLSVPWAPPEAFDDHPEMDRRSDVYSLAATLYSLIEGRTPFEVPGGANSIVHLTRRIDRGEMTPWSGEVPETLTAALTRAMSVDAGARPASARDLGEALQLIQRERGNAATRFDIVRIEKDDAADAEAHLDEALVETQVRPRAPVVAPVEEPPGQTTVTREAEDVAPTQGDPSKPEAVADSATERLSPRTRAIAICSVLALAGAAIVTLLVGPGQAMPWCGPAYGMPIYVPYAASLVRDHPPFCGATTLVGDVYFYERDAGSGSVTNFLRSTGNWTCSSISLGRCRERDTGVTATVSAETAYGSQGMDAGTPKFVTRVQINR